MTRNQAESPKSLSKRPQISEQAPAKISGFTVVRNAVKMGYPIKPSILSLLPIVDEMIVAVGQSEDQTRELIESIESPKIKIIDTVWDMKKTQGGLILSEKTNEALKYCKNDWCFYLQADEVLHEDDHAPILTSLEKANSHENVQGLLFEYVHFYGSYSTIARSRKWYRNEIRLIKKSSGAQSYKDAQGFRIKTKDNPKQKLNVISSQARVFHYGWVKPPEQMGAKARLLDYWWQGENARKEETDKNFYYDNQYGLQSFQESHPEVMKELVQKQDWEYVPQRTWRDFTFKDFKCWTSDLFEKTFHHRIGEYRPYKLLK